MRHGDAISEYEYYAAGFFEFVAIPMIDHGVGYENVAEIGVAVEIDIRFLENNPYGHMI